MGWRRGLRAIFVGIFYRNIGARISQKNFKKVLDKQILNC
jgi:hypothetical protein